MLDRRQALLGATALAMSAGLAGPGRAQAPQSPKARLDALMDRFFEEGLQAQPEGATELGLDKGPRAGLKSKLEDVSTAGMAAARAMRLAEPSTRVSNVSAPFRRLRKAPDADASSSGAGAAMGSAGGAVGAASAGDGNSGSVGLTGVARGASANSTSTR